ncbi:MAG: hypothetical protein ACYC27_13120, partial [Armatimonadota bacterium]
VISVVQHLNFPMPLTSLHQQFLLPELGEGDRRSDEGSGQVPPFKLKLQDQDNCHILMFYLFEASGASYRSKRVLL